MKKRPTNEVIDTGAKPVKEKGKGRENKLRPAGGRGRKLAKKASGSGPANGLGGKHTYVCTTIHSPSQTGKKEAKHVPKLGKKKKRNP